jgi:hypothetical protein
MQKAKAQAGAVTSGGLPAVGAPTLHSLTSAGAKTLKKAERKQQAKSAASFITIESARYERGR